MMSKSYTDNTIIIGNNKYDSKKIIKYDISYFIENEIYDDYKLANYLYIYFEFPELNNLQIVLTQDFGLNKGGTFWDGSYLLSKYFLDIMNNKGITSDITKSNNESGNMSTKNIKILELGAGTSLPSIMCGLLGYDVTITDIKSLIKFIEKNVKLNVSDITKPPYDNIKIRTLEWGNEVDIQALKADNNDYDYIFGSEIIYIEETFPQLIETLKYFCGTNTKIILVYKVRIPQRIQTFFDMFNKDFNCEYIPQTKALELLPNPELNIVMATKKDTIKQ